MINLADLLAFGGLCLILALSFYCVRSRFFAWAGAPVLGLILTALTVNLGLMPTPGETKIYSILSGPILSTAVFLLLLQVNREMILKAGPKMAGAFAIGSAGVFFGTLIGAALLTASFNSMDKFPALAAMFTGTYTGGGVNFNTLAAALGVTREGPQYAVAVAVDSVFTAVWLAVSVIAAMIIRKRHKIVGASSDASNLIRQSASNDESDGTTAKVASAPISVTDLTVLGAAASAAIWISQLLNTAIPGAHPLIWLTGLAIIAAQTPLGRMGARVEPLAVVALYLFICAIGADVSIAAVAAASGLASLLIAFVVIIIACHALAITLSVRWLGIDSDIALVSSQAAIGGPPTAMALAETIGRQDLRVPGAATGLIGYAVGTYLGLAAYAILK